MKKLLLNFFLFLSILFAFISSVKANPDFTYNFKGKGYTFFDCVGLKDNSVLLMGSNNNGLYLVKVSLEMKVAWEVELKEKALSKIYSYSSFSVEETNDHLYVISPSYDEIAVVQIDKKGLYKFNKFKGHLSNQNKNEFVANNKLHLILIGKTAGGVNITEIQPANLSIGKEYFLKYPENITDEILDIIGITGTTVFFVCNESSGLVVGNIPASAAFLRYYKINNNEIFKSHIFSYDLRNKEQNTVVLSSKVNDKFLLWPTFSPVMQYRSNYNYIMQNGDSAIYNYGLYGLNENKKEFNMQNKNDAQGFFIRKFDLEGKLIYKKLIAFEENGISSKGFQAVQTNFAIRSVSQGNRIFVALKSEKSKTLAGFLLDEEGNLLETIKDEKPHSLPTNFMHVFNSDFNIYLSAIYRNLNLKNDHKNTNLKTLKAISSLHKMNNDQYFSFLPDQKLVLQYNNDSKVVSLYKSK